MLGCFSRHRERLRKKILIFSQISFASVWLTAVENWQENMTTCWRKLKQFSQIWFPSRNESSLGNWKRFSHFIPSRGLALGWIFRFLQFYTLFLAFVEFLHLGKYPQIMRISKCIIGLTWQYLFIFLLNAVLYALPGDRFAVQFYFIHLEMQDL